MVYFFSIILFLTLPAFGSAEKADEKQRIIHLSSQINNNIFRTDAELGLTKFLAQHKKNSNFLNMQTTASEDLNPKILKFHELPEHIKLDFCPICFYGFEERKNDGFFDTIFKNSCGHYCHLNCLNNETDQEKNSCKICHQQIATDEKKELEKELIDLNFDNNTSLGTLIGIFADKKGLAYSLTKEVEAIKVPALKTYRSNTLDEIWEIILTFLKDNGCSFETRDNLLIFAKDAQIYPIYSSRDGIRPDLLPDSDQVIRYMYYLKNVKSDIATSILNQLLNEQPISIGNYDILLIKDKSRTIRHALQIIFELDNGGLRQDLVIHPLKHTDPEFVANFLTKEVIGSVKGSTDRIRYITPNKKSLTYFSPDVKVFPYLNRKSLIFLGPKVEVDRYRHFVDLTLDVEIDAAKSRIHIYEVKYHSPEKLKNLLDRMIKTSSGPNSAEKFKDTIIYAEQQSNENNAGGNRLIVAGTDEEWMIIENLIKELDKPLKTIAIEVMVVNASQSLQRLLSSHIRDAKGGAINPNVSFRTNSFADTLNVASGNSSFSNISREATLPPDFLNDQGSNVMSLKNLATGILDKDAWAFIKSKATQNNSAIIYQPFMVTKSNETTKWMDKVTRQVPGELLVTASKTSRRQVPLDAQVSLNLTPRVNIEGLIDMDVEIIVQEFLPIIEGQQDTPETTSRSVKTRVFVGMGEVLVLGGFDISKLTKTRYGFPLLEKIPIIGNLFRSLTKLSDKTQTMFFLRASTMKQELQPGMDDYTALKVKYAKYQVGNVDNVSEEKDPIVRVFFKPRHSSLAQSKSDQQNSRFKYIDDFVEAKTSPLEVNMINDPAFNSGLKNEDEKKVSPTKSYWEENGYYPKKNILANLKHKKPRRSNQNLVIENITTPELI